MINNLQDILQGMDQKTLTNNINSVKPLEMLQQLGFGGGDAQKILEGDITPISNQVKVDIMDFSSVMKNHGQSFNVNLIRFFFKKAQSKEDYTDEEIEAYQEEYKKWFDFIFEIGEQFAFNLDADLDDTTIFIKVDSLYYQMSIFDDLYEIFCLGEKPPIKTILNR
jgi:hypothetical protein